MTRSTSSLICVLLLSSIFAILSSFVIFFSATLFVFFKLHLLEFASFTFPTFAILTLILGCLTLITGLSSVCGVFSQSTLHLTFNAILHGFLILLQIFALILAMELRNYTEDFVECGTKGWYDILNNYNENNPSTKNLVDTLQIHFQCCGGQSSDAYTIWMNFEPFHKDSSVPESCCMKPALNCGQDLTSLPQIYSQIHNRGCLDKIQSDLHDSLEPCLFGFTIAGIVFALLHLLTLIVTLMAISAIRQEREWERQEELKQKLVGNQQQRKCNTNETQVL